MENISAAISFLLISRKWWILVVLSKDKYLHGKYVSLLIFTQHESDLSLLYFFSHLM